jgi:hypothetical protein
MLLAVGNLDEIGEKFGSCIQHNRRLPGDLPAVDSHETQLDTPPKERQFSDILAKDCRGCSSVGVKDQGASST